MSTQVGTNELVAGVDSKIRRVILGTSAGTIFESYDFILFGSLAPVISRHFFSGVNETAGFIFALMTFAAGFAIRPLGALLFGRIGDRRGRKGTFLVTLILTGFSTFLIGTLPTYASVGILSPILLITMRLIQGLAFGGEYGGAVIYLAEHSPRERRGFFTGWIQTSMGFGIFSSLVVILATRTAIGEDVFQDWGWRIPFLISIFLLVCSVWIRLKLEESPVFQRMKRENAQSRAPLKEAFLEWRNLKLVLIALFGLMAPYGVLWYTAHFYTQFFLDRVLKVEPTTVNWIMILVTGVGIFQYVFFGWLSDRVGRRRVMMWGMALGTLTLIPFFHIITNAANPALARAQEAAPVVVAADPRVCSVQFDPIGQASFNSSCDIAKSYLAGRGISYDNAQLGQGDLTLVQVGEAVVPSVDLRGLSGEAMADARAAFETRLGKVLAQAGYPERAAPEQMNMGLVILVILIGVTCANAIFGPIAATLVELFPTRIRYSALSLPYHIGAGWFGGFLPATAFAMVAGSGNIYFGLWYPFVIGIIGVVVLVFFLPETRDRDLHRIGPA